MVSQRNWRDSHRHPRRVIVIGVIALLLGAGSLQATPLNLTSGIPDFFNMFATVAYTPGSGSSLVIDGMGHGSVPHFEAVEPGRRHTPNKIVGIVYA